MEKKKVFLSELMRKAWQMVKAYGVTLAEAMHKMWAIARLKKLMATRIVQFTFQKLDGTIRTAWGTLMQDRISVVGSTDRKPNDSLTAYWDTEKEAWRSFKNILFQGVVA